MISIGTKAPHFDLPLAGGGRVSPANVYLEKRGGLLVFFKSECPTCRLAFPFLQKIYARTKTAADPIGFLAIAQNPAGEMPEFFKKYGAEFPVACDGEPYAASNAYGITNVPSIFIFDEHGIIIKTIVGFSKKEYDAATEELLSRAGAKGQASIFSEADFAVPAMQPG